jgi:hypothetical protein
MLLYPGIRFHGTEEELSRSLPYVTDVLSFLDYLASAEQSIKPRLGRESIARLRVVLDRAICEVLSEPCQMTVDGFQRFDSDGARLIGGIFRNRQDALWTRLKKFIEDATTSPSDRLTVITTNYDLLLDSVLREVLNGSCSSNECLDLGFDYRNVESGKIVQRPSNSPSTRAARISLLKLHGSLNYLRCDICDQVYVNPNGDIAYLAFDRAPSPENTCHCGHGPLRHVIVAPSTVRAYRIPQVLSTWAVATEALRTSQEWIFVGYSLPAEDLAIRSMLYRAWHARGQVRSQTVRIDEWRYHEKPTITVVQKTDSTRPAYELIFGDHNYIGGGFEAYLPSAVNCL